MKINASNITLWLLGISIICGSGSAIVLVPARSAIMEANRTFLQIRSPCPELREDETWFLDKNYALKKYTGEWMKAQCRNQFTKGLDSIFGELKSCLDHDHRSKRSLAQLAWIAAEVVSVGVTNFLKSKNQHAHYEEIDAGGLTDRMAATVSASSRQMLSYDPDERVRAIASVSESAPHHQDELSLLARHIPVATWAAAHTQQEILAGLANLRTIAKYCRRGQVATYELAELTDDDFLATIDPIQTELLDLLADREAAAVTLTFVVREETLKHVISRLNWIPYWVYMIIAEIVLAPILLLSVHWLKNKVVKTIPQEQAQDFELEP